MIRWLPTTHRCGLSVLLLILAVANAGGAGSEDLDGASTHQSAADFIRDLYAEYATGKPTPNPTGPQASQIFAQSTLTLLRKDQEVPHGEVGRLDFDPICDCQDYQDIHNVVVSTKHGSDGRTTVTARFSDGGKKKVVQFEIVSEGDRWRIYDIHASLAPSLRKLLTVR